MEVDCLQNIGDAVGKLPSRPLEDLLSCGVCVRCVSRLFGFHDQILSYPFLSTPVLEGTFSRLTEVNDGTGLNISVVSSGGLTEKECVQESQEFDVCKVCFGILQYAFRDENGMLVKKKCAGDFAAVIGDHVKQDGHQVDGFFLEVSLPQLVAENEQAVWLFMKNKYGTESWFLDKPSSGSVSVKEFLKMSLTTPLEHVLGVRHSESCFRIRLTYTLSDASARTQQTPVCNSYIKRRKVDGTDDSVILKECVDMNKNRSKQLTPNSLAVMQNDGKNGFLPDEVNECCSLIFHSYRTSIYVGGRYLKYSRNVSQTRWIIDDERMGEASVEEIIGSSVLPICQGDVYKFHAAGREDIDVRMLGSGRPFLVEIQNARNLPSDLLLKEMEERINNLETKFVGVKHLKFLGSHGWELMREGEAEKQKQYCALVWISRPLGSDDEQKLSSIEDMQIVQKTPIRVLHRRSPLEREKTIHWMRMERISGRPHYFLLHLCTQAGTYIKEFVHGDFGRTHPSLGSILGCRAEILQLDVTDVKMDCFQE